jgi:hypothetical protein
LVVEFGRTEKGLDPTHGVLGQFRECPGTVLGDRLAVGLLDLVVHLLAMDGDIRGSFDADLHEVSIEADDLDDDAAVDDHAFARFAGED